tara:strand:- start:700 stop:990 length:291 start_codon:yes stop_codon:yes gene_type:complete
VSIDIRGFTIHKDPWSEWLEVDLDDLRMVNMSPFSFSKESKRDGERVFLEEEEDCDLFIESFYVKYGERKQAVYITKEYEELCFIRDLKSVKESDA